MSIKRENVLKGFISTFNRCHGRLTYLEYELIGFNDEYSL